MDPTSIAPLKPKFVWARQAWTSVRIYQGACRCRLTAAHVGITALHTLRTSCEITQPTSVSRMAFSIWSKPRFRHSRSIRGTNACTRSRGSWLTNRLSGGGCPTTSAGGLEPGVAEGTSAAVPFAAPDLLVDPPFAPAAGRLSKPAFWQYGTRV